MAEKIKVALVGADTNPRKVEEVKNEYGLKEEMCFASYKRS